LQEKNIPTAVHYPIPLNLQPAVQNLEAHLPVGNEVAKKVMSLPMHPYLSKDEVESVVGALLVSL
jgi:UDP-2-acetamido-2-deoxy-ribo-hexuluronate aminotransferase